jgi:hypothetical protein
MTTAQDRRDRASVVRDVERAQAGEARPHRESQEQRDARVAADRRRVHERQADIEKATRAVHRELVHADETEQERSDRIAGGRKAVLERQATVDAAVAAENEARRKALGIPLVPEGGVGARLVRAAAAARDALVHDRQAAVQDAQAAENTRRAQLQANGQDPNTPPEGSDAG